MKEKTYIILWVLSILILIAGFFSYNTLLADKNDSKNSIDSNWCKDVKITFFPGGSPGGAFESIVYNGAKKAQEDLGPTVEYVWSNWDTDTMISQFKEQIDKKPDVIAMMGHPGEELLGPFIDEAERKGIMVTLQNVDIESSREKYVEKGFGYTGQVLYDSGFSLGKASAIKFDLKKGDEAIVLGLLSEAGRGVRTQGCIDGLKEKGVTVDYEEFPKEVNADANSPEAETFFKKILEKYPNAKLIVVDHGSITAATPTILKNLGKKPGEVIITGFDLSGKTVEGIRNGYIGLISDQQPFLQGYIPILQACLSKKYGFAGLYVDTGVGLVDSSNVESLAKLAEEQIR